MPTNIYFVCDIIYLIEIERITQKGTVNMNSNVAQQNTITNVVFYHGGCLDGIGAAYCHFLYSGNGEKTKYVPMKHNEINVDAIKSKLSDVDLSLVEDVCVLDFNLNKSCYDYLLDSNPNMKVTVIDHHKTAKEEIETMKGDYANKNIIFHFNLNYSGAFLSYVYFAMFIQQNSSIADGSFEAFVNANQASVPYWTRMIQDRDLWRWQEKDTKAFTTVLHSKVCNTENAHDYHNDNIPLELDIVRQINLNDENSVVELITIGNVMNEQYDNQIQSIMTNKGYFEVDFPLVGKGYAINANNLFSSELGSKLCRLDEQHKFAIVFCFSDNQTIKCSIRSTDDFDCSGIAKYFGGGGHPQASGFSLSFEQFQKYILGLS